MGLMSALILVVTAMPAASSGAQGGAPSDDLRCYAAAVDMVRAAGNRPEASSIQGLAYFFEGRLSVIDPNANWSWIAASEKPLSPEKVLPTFEFCAARVSRLTHLTGK